MFSLPGSGGSSILEELCTCSCCYTHTHTYMYATAALWFGAPWSCLWSSPHRLRSMTQKSFFSSSALCAPSSSIYNWAFIYAANASARPLLRLSLMCMCVCVCYTQSKIFNYVFHALYVDFSTCIYANQWNTFISYNLILNLVILVHFFLLNSRHFDFTLRQYEKLQHQALECCKTYEAMDHDFNDFQHCHRKYNSVAAL